MIERSLVLMKPDAVKRGVVGEILHRFERSGLKIIGAKMLHPEREFVEKHYSASEENLRAIGNKTLTNYAESGVDVVAEMGTNDSLALGKQIIGWTIDYLISGPVMAIVLEGPHAIENIRTLTGFTLPLKAAPGTIRGDFGLESSISANKRKRSIYNLLHASGNKEEAEMEIKLWFKPGELLNYRRIHEDLYNY